MSMPVVSVKSFRPTILAAPLVVLAGFPAFAAEIGVSAAVRGQVGVSSQSRTYTPKNGDALYLGDRVTSKANSGMQVMLLDETTFTIGADCDLTLDKFIYDPSAGQAELAATVSKGALRYVSGLVAKDAPEKVNLRTPTATISVRGTTADIIVGQAAIDLAKAQGYDVSNADPKNATFFLLRGPGDERNTIDRQGAGTITSGGKSVNLSRPGFVTFVPYFDAPPFEPMRISEEVERILAQNVRGGSNPPAGPGGSSGGNGGTDTAANQSGQDGVQGKSFATGSANNGETKTSLLQEQSQDQDPPLEPLLPPLQPSGVTNNIGLEIATYEMPTRMGAAETYSQTGVIIYDNSGGSGTAQDRYGPDAQINVWGAEGRDPIGTYDFSVTVTPHATEPSAIATFSNIDVPGAGASDAFIVGQEQIDLIADPDMATDPAFGNFDYTDNDSVDAGCIALQCDAAVDLIGNPTDLVTGATHSLELQGGAALGTGHATSP